MTQRKRRITIDFVAKITFSTEVPGLLTFTEAATLLGTSRPYIYYLIDHGRLHRIDIGDGGYVLRDEVEKLKVKRCPTCGAELEEGVKIEAEATTTPASN